MNFRVPASWVRMQTLEAHTGGEPLRIVTGGFPEILGDTMLARRRYAAAHFDHLRRALMLEPRGHADMYGAILTPSVTEDGDAGVLFLHNEGFSTMCGHGVIAVVALGVEFELLPSRGSPPVVRLDTPAGRVTATAHLCDGRVERVSFRNVASFVLARDQSIRVPGLGSVRYDLAFGGAFYAYVDAAALELEIAPENIERLIDVGRRIKAAVAARGGIEHPDGDPDLNFLYGVILMQPGDNGAHSRNVCVFADGEVDRSPTGTGVSGRAAILHARGELAVGESIEIESVIGTRFGVSVAATTRVRDIAAVVPEVSGAAYLTGRSEFVVDPADPLGEGFMLR